MCVVRGRIAAQTGGKRVHSSLPLAYNLVFPRANYRVLDSADGGGRGSFTQLFIVKKH